MDNLLELPSRLDQRRRGIGMSKKTVAKRSGVSLPTVNRILSGREKRLTLTNIEAIARVLGVVVQIGAKTGFEEIGTSRDVRKRQAAMKARQVVKMVQGTMGLESQAVEPALLEQM